MAVGLLGPVQAGVDSVKGIQRDKAIWGGGPPLSYGSFLFFLVNMKVVRDTSGIWDYYKTF